MNIENEVKTLTEKASNTDKSEDALRFSQAALNLAHTQAVMKKDNKG